MKSCTFPTALSIHQLAAQGEVTQVAAHLSKGEHHATFSTDKVKSQNPPLNYLWPVLFLQTVHCSANRTNGASPLSCGQQRLERRQWWIFSWKRSESSDCRLRRRHAPLGANALSHWGILDLCFRVQTPKRLRGSGRVPWHWPALGVMWTLWSLFSDMG